MRCQQPSLFNGMGGKRLIGTKTHTYTHLGAAEAVFLESNRYLEKVKSKIYNYE